MRYHCKEYLLGSGYRNDKGHGHGYGNGKGYPYRGGFSGSLFPAMLVTGVKLEEVVLNLPLKESHGT